MDRRGVGTQQGQQAGVGKGADGEGAHMKQHFIISKMTMKLKTLPTRKP